MSGEIILTIVGNLTGDVETRAVGGTTVASFTVAQTARKYADGEWVDAGTTFIRCSAWREIGEHVAGSLSKGMRVIVQGRYAQRDYETKEGEKRIAYELEVDEIGPSLRYATAVVQKAQSNRNQGQRREQYAQQQGAPRTQGDAGGGRRPVQAPPAAQAAGDRWGGYDDETPF